MFNTLIIFSASYLYFAVIAIAGIYFLLIPRHQQKDLVILAVIALPCIYLASRAAAYFYFDPRPFVFGHFVPLNTHSPDKGFPSDHALLTSAIASVVWFYNKKISAVLWILTIVVGVSRVLAEVHHLTDVAGAILLSVVITGLIEYLLKRSKIISYKK